MYDDAISYLYNYNCVFDENHKFVRWQTDFQQRTYESVRGDEIKDLCAIALKDVYSEDKLKELYYMRTLLIFDEETQRYTLIVSDADCYNEEQRKV